MMADEPPYLLKARESLRGAEREFAAAYNNCANRAYYACFQAAIAALQRANIRPQGGVWSHAYLPSQFDGVLIYRRKLYPTTLRGILERAYDLRVTADYDEDFVTRAEAERLPRRARLFVETVASGRGGSQS